jgi:hypothetical protein
MPAVSDPPGALALDDQGRVDGNPDSAPNAPEAIARAFEALLCAELGIIGARTVDTPNGHLGMMTLREGNGTSLAFWAGTALRADRAAALRDAAIDAVLGAWHGSVIVAGAARLVAEGTCRAAMVIDDRGVATYGPTTEFPPFGTRGAPPQPGARLAARSTRGEFQALSLGGASVMLNVVPGEQHALRVESWFDELEAALA